MYLVVAVIVILVVTITLLGIFITGINNASGFTNARANCISMGTSLCSSIGELPSTWSESKVTYEGKVGTCATITGIKDCTGFGVTRSNPLPAPNP